MTLLQNVIIIVSLKRIQIEVQKGINYLVHLLTSIKHYNSTTVHTFKVN